MLAILNKPYPRNNNIKHRTGIVLLSGLFVSIVLLFIISFQTGYVFSSALFINVFLFGLVTVVCLSITELLLPFIFKNFFVEQYWTIWKNIFMWMVMLFVISIGNMLMANWLYNSSVSWNTFSHFLYYTLGVGFFVYAIFNMINYNRLVKKNEAGAELMNAEISSATFQVKGPSKIEEAVLIKEKANGLISIISENGKETISLSIEDLLYIESADNYSKIIHLKESKPQTSIIRSSLKRVDGQLNNPEIYRCHRSYLVNLKKVASVSGNSQGYLLHLKETIETIPVSRNSGKEFLERLKTLAKN